MTTSYCAPADLTSWGLAAAQSDCDLASQIIDDYLGVPAINADGSVAYGWFSQAVSLTYTASDVRRPTMVLPKPFSSITQVKVDNAHVLDTTQIIVEPWGIRLYQPTYFDADGFPRRIMAAIGYDWRLSNRSPYGSQIAVTATYGFATTPAKVKRAAMLIVQKLLQQPSDINIDRRVRQVQVEGYRAMWDATQGDHLESTGSLEADRLLSGLRVLPMVA